MNPTNDLDVETLDVLEDRLAEYQGTLIVVSHDRQFLDNTVTSILVFEDGSNIRQYVGGYSDWLRQGHSLTETDTLSSAKSARQQAAKSRASAATKLSYKEQTELKQLPEKIERLEKEIAKLQTKTTKADFYSQDYATIESVTTELATKTAQLDQLGERWLEMEEQQAQHDKGRK